MKTRILLVATSLLCLSLTGCQQPKTNTSQKTVQNSHVKKKSNSHSNAKKKAKPASDDRKQTETSATNKNQTLWNSTKDQALATFMTSWGQTMKQDYHKYDGTNSLHVSVGIDYPDMLPTEQVNGQEGLLGWTPTGKGSYQYNVVAIYNHDGTEPPLPNRITYFFCFDQQGTPIILVDESRDGPARAVPTANQQLLAGFKKIAQQ
jgi:hypothetical protein